ncbi:hypothetical protein JTE90_021600 [Oedothorax gibbosus]|uniref:Uncharacterized protein n=1 Tax=Oedothorax gibbosus TaxID=931172 RepID=A0AAV6VNU9_9ARAC|nr:hypothetical protein JTE90_021600 [Oedothorax gibbosus]
MNHRPANDPLLGPKYPPPWLTDRGVLMSVSIEQPMQIVFKWLFNSVLFARRIGREQMSRPNDYFINATIVAAERNARTLGTLAGIPLQFVDE